MKTNFNLNNIIRPNILSLKSYSSARDEFNESENNMIFLDANENPFQNGVNRYPDSKQRKVKHLLSTIKNITAENIFLGNGSDEIIDLIIRAFCVPNHDSAIVLPPTYGMYEVLLNINDIRVIKIQLNQSFQPDIDKVLNAITSATKLVFICSPNNPTANNINSKKIEKLLKEFRGLVVIDEAYIDFSKKMSWLNRLHEFSNLIIIQTLSKSFGMAGVRLGICYASVEILSILNKIKPPYNVNELTQQYVIKCLSKKELIYKEIKSIIKERELLIPKLKTIGFILKIYPSEANFILIKVDNACKRYDELIKRGIVVRNRTLQVMCKNTLRLTIGTTIENEKLVKTLKSL